MDLLNNYEDENNNEQKDEQEIDQSIESINNPTSILPSFEKSSLKASTTARRVASKIFKRQRDESSSSSSSSFYDTTVDLPVSSDERHGKNLSLSSTIYETNKQPSVSIEAKNELYLDKRMRRELGLDDSKADLSISNTNTVNADLLRSEWQVPSIQSQTDTGSSGNLPKVVGKSWSHAEGAVITTSTVSQKGRKSNQILSVAASSLKASASLSIEHSIGQKSKAQTWAKYGW
jgi:hypothetical protein